MDNLNQSNLPDITLLPSQRLGWIEIIENKTYFDKEINIYNVHLEGDDSVFYNIYRYKNGEWVEQAWSSLLIEKTVNEIKKAIERKVEVSIVE